MTAVERDGLGNPIHDAAGNPVVTSRTIICAEPSPDAIVAAASYFDSNFSSGDNSGSASSGFGEAVGNIGLRTQTIQLLRDGYFRVCEAYLNGAIGYREYVGIVSAIDHFMAVLVSIEAISGSPTIVPVTVSAGASSTQVTGADGSVTDTQEIELGSNTLAALENLTAQLQRVGQLEASTAHRSEAIRQILFQYLHYLEELEERRYQRELARNARMD